MAVVAAAMVVAAAAEAAAGLEVAATAGSLGAEVAAGSEGAAAAAAAAAAGSLTFGSVVTGPAAYPGGRAACAKSHDRPQPRTLLLGLRLHKLLSGSSVGK
jgi:hypothetical protein